MAIKCRKELMGGLYMGLNTKHIVLASKMVAEYSGLHVQRHKVIVGANAFAHESGINQTARNIHISYFWNRLPEVGSQYVYLFTQLDKSVHFHQKFWSFYLEEPSYSVHRAYYLKARDIARTLNLDKLIDEDIRQCFVDVFAEWDSIAEYKLKTEYDLFLLDCIYNQNLHLKNFTPKIILQSWIVRILILPFNNGSLICGWRKTAQDCKRNAQASVGPIIFISPNVGIVLSIISMLSSPNDELPANVEAAVTTQDVLTMIRCGQNTIFFLINNGGYKIELEIHDGPYNVSLRFTTDLIM